MPASNHTDPARPVHPANRFLILATLFPDEEIWATILDFDGYEVSSRARMRSYFRQVNSGDGYGYRTIRFSSPQSILKPSPNPRGGHPRYGLRRDGKTYCKQVGHWMLLAFVGPWPGKGWYCCHNDGNCLNNDLSNLRWDTKHEDGWDRMRHGTHNVSQLDAEIVRQIRRSVGAGESRRAVARSLGIARSTVSKIVLRHTWGWVE